MRIGIDIDGVLTDVERFQLDYGSKYWFENNRGEITNPNAYRVSELFGENQKLDREFWNEYRELYGEEEKIRPFAAEIINRLKKDGHEIYIITARFFTNEETEKGEQTREIVRNWLENNKVIYDELIFSSEDKLQICMDNKIDIMIDDSTENVTTISKLIPVICYDAGYNKKCVGDNIIRCYSWYDIYSKISKI